MKNDIQILSAAKNNLTQALAKIINQDARISTAVKNVLKCSEK